MAFRNISENDYDAHYEALKTRYISYLMHNVSLLETTSVEKRLFLESFVLLIDGAGLRYVSHLIKNIFDAYQRAGRMGLTDHYNRLKIIYC